MLLETIIDQAQSQLHDDGVIWSRAELLRWANDGYRELVSNTRCVTRPYQIDLPGRTAWAATHQWEDRHAQGTVHFWTKPARSTAQLQMAFKWEVEQAEGIATTTDGLESGTQLWERAYGEETDDHFTFVLPSSNERPLKVYWDSKRLAHTSVREADQAETDWWREFGEPIAWLPGVGRERTFEVFEVHTEYYQGWDLKGYENGIPRFFDSDVNAERTYVVDSRSNLWDFGYATSADVTPASLVAGLGLRVTVALIDGTIDTYGVFTWERDPSYLTLEPREVDDSIKITAEWEDGFISDEETKLGLGLTRRIQSEDRQYLATSYDSGQDLLGSPRRIATSENAITVWQSIVPTRHLTEDDEPDLIPAQLHKYLKFYTLGKAFGRVGEGYRPDLAQHFAQLYQLGAGLLAMLGTPSVLDRVFAREQTQDSSIVAPPRVRFPSTFERIF